MIVMMQQLWAKEELYSHGELLLKQYAESKKQSTVELIGEYKADFIHLTYM